MRGASFGVPIILSPACVARQVRSNTAGLAAAPKTKDEKKDKYQVNLDQIIPRLLRGLNGVKGTLVLLFKRPTLLPLEPIITFELEVGRERRQCRM